MNSCDKVVHLRLFFEKRFQINHFTKNWKEYFQWNTSWKNKKATKNWVRLLNSFWPFFDYFEFQRRSWMRVASYVGDIKSKPFNGSYPRRRTPHQLLFQTVLLHSGHEREFSIQFHHWFFLTIFKYVINSTFLILHTEMHSYIYSILTLTVKPILMLCYSKGGSRLPCWSYQGSASKISWLCKPLFSKSSLMRCSMLMPPHCLLRPHHHQLEVLHFQISTPDTLLRVHEPNLI